MRYGNYVLSNCKYPTKKENFNFKEIRTNGLCISAAVPYHLSYEDPYIESRPLLAPNGMTHEDDVNCRNTNCK